MQNFLIFLLTQHFAFTGILCIVLVSATTAVVCLSIYAASFMQQVAKSHAKKLSNSVLELLGAKINATLGSTKNNFKLAYEGIDHTVAPFEVRADAYVTSIISAFQFAHSDLVENHFALDKHQVILEFQKYFDTTTFYWKNFINDNNLWAAVVISINSMSSTELHSKLVNKN